MLSETFHRCLYSLLFERDIFLRQRKMDAPRRWNVRKLSEIFSKKPDGEISPVPVLHDYNAEVIFMDYIQKKKPVLLKGAAKNWPASEKWSFDSFKKQFANDDVYIANEIFERNSDGVFYNINLLPYKMGKFVDEVNAGSDVYLKFLPTFKQHPELLEDLGLKEMYEWSHNTAKKYNVTHEFYMGGKYSITHLHTERSDIFHACLVGTKRWRLYGPENSIYLYPVPARTLFIASEVNFLEQDFKTHPWFRYANGFEVIMEAGDVLYFPAYYWHAVENLSPVISANYLWYVPWRAINALPLMWLNGEILRTRGAGTIDQFIKFFSGKMLPSLHS